MADLFWLSDEQWAVVASDLEEVWMIPESRNRCKAFLGDVIDDVEDAHPSTTGELIVDEVDRPARVGKGREKQRRP
jgi:hypothetical protein